MFPQTEQGTELLCLAQVDFALLVTSDANRFRFRSASFVRHSLPPYLKTPTNSPRAHLVWISQQVDASIGCFDDLRVGKHLSAGCRLIADSICPWDSPQQRIGSIAQAREVCQRRYDGTGTPTLSQSFAGIPRGFRNSGNTYLPNISMLLMTAL
jgi:hypothetical protein